MKIDVPLSLQGFAELDIGCAIASDANVIVSGGEASARRMIARRVYERGLRRDGPFITLAVDRVEPSWVAATGGTLFIDELCDLDAWAQGELMRLLDSNYSLAGSSAEAAGRPVRVIAAVGCALIEWIRAQGLDEDLFYRLNTIHIAIDD